MRANITHTYTYDAFDRPTSHRIGSHLLSTQYSPYGETVKASWKFNDSATGTLVYDYIYGTDSKRTLASMTVGAFEERYAQDVLGRSVGNTRRLGGKTYAERYGYYKRGDRATSRINTISYAKDGLTGDKLTYTYDSFGVLSARIGVFSARRCLGKSQLRVVASDALAHRGDIGILV